MTRIYLQAAFVLLVTFGLGFMSALSLTGYGVRQGVRHIVFLWRYRTGRCPCYLCRDAASASLKAQEPQP